MNKDLLIGFIGQGFIGKNYADDFENRNYKIVRYDIDSYSDNKDKIKEADIVLIAVPTPTTPQGFDYSIVQEVLKLIGKGKIAVIKSTLQLGTTRKLQELYPDITVMHSPEFLREVSAAEDAKKPNRNIVGIVDKENKDLYKKADLVMKTLAKAPYELITNSEDAEMIKYGGNCFLYTKVIFMNIFYDLINKNNLDFETIKTALAADPRIGDSHLGVVHDGGRGAGGHCFIKDFEAFIEMLDKNELSDQSKTAQEIRNLNLKYLRDSGKNLDLIKDIYGK